MKTGNSGKSGSASYPGASRPVSVDAATSPTPKARMDWPDIAKGLSILGVVLLHVTLNVPGAKDSFLAEINHFLDPLRMSLFFLVSGFFSVKVLNQTFGQLFRGRLWFFLVPYVLWAPVDLLASRVEGLLYSGHRLPDFWYYINKLINSTNMYWFLYFLILFNLILWATRKLPGWAICVVLLLPWLLMPAFGENEVLRKTIIYLPAFFIGAYFRPLITRFAEAASRPKAVIIAVAFYVSGMGVVAYADFLETRMPGPTQLWMIALKNDTATLLGGELSAFDLGHIPGVLVRLCSLPAGIVLAVWLAKIKPVAAVLKFCGQHTLSIYIGHALGLTIFFGYIFEWTVMSIDNDSSNPMHWTTTWMVIAFALAMVGSYIVHLISKVPFLGWSLTPPKLPERSREGAVLPTPRAQTNADNQNNATIGG